MGALSTVSSPDAFIIQLISLTGIPAFIARYDLKMLDSQYIREIAMKRLCYLNELSSIANWSDAKKSLQENGIRWFVALPKENLNRDINREFSVFPTNGISVYDTRS